MEIKMEEDKLWSLLLLDLCAFTVMLYGQESREEVLRDYQIAYNIAENLDLPEIDTYREFMERL